MEVGIGLPNAVPAAAGTDLTEFARRAEARGFSSLGTIDRIAYDNYEPLTALAAAAAVTERIGLATTVLLAPLRANAVELAKQALSVNALSDGRLTLGVGLGGRGDDYEISGLETKGRGRRFDEMLERIGEVWKGDEVGPARAGAPRLRLRGRRLRRADPLPQLQRPRPGRPARRRRRAVGDPIAGRLSDAASAACASRPRRRSSRRPRRPARSSLRRRPGRPRCHRRSRKSFRRGLPTPAFR